MQIVYCEKCSLRISVDQLEDGRAAKVDENTFLCADCAPLAKPVTPAAGAPQNKPAPGSRTRLKAVVEVTRPSPKPVKTPVARPPSVPLAVLLPLALGLLFAVWIVVSSQPHENTRPFRGNGNPAAVAEANGASQKPGSPPLPTPATQPAQSVTARPPVQPEPPAAVETPALRQTRAAHQLAEIKDWLEYNPGQTEEYKKRLLAFSAAFPDTPAALEARKLAGTIAQPGVVGRFVRIELPGTDFLHIAEVEVFAGGTQSVSAGKKASQSSTIGEWDAGRAVDGKTDNNWSHTQRGRANWWEVDLGSAQPLTSIVIWNRMDQKEVIPRLSNFKVRVLKDDRSEAWSTVVKDPPNPSVRLELASPQAAPVPAPAASGDAPKSSGISGRFVRVSKGAGMPLAVTEVDVYSGGTDSIAKGKRATIAAKGQAREVKTTVDGNPAGVPESTAGIEDQNHWWEVDLEREQPISGLALWVHKTSSRANMKISIEILKSDRTVIWSSPQTVPDRPPIRLIVK